MRHRSPISALLLAAALLVAPALPPALPSAAGLGLGAAEPAAPAAGVREQVIDYADEGTALRGVAYLPAAAAAGPVPGVVVVHEWWGRNDYAGQRARELAAAGFAAFALDMYGAGKATEDPQQAGAWAGPFYQDRAALVRRATAGLAQLRALPGVDGGRLSAIGFCFGGTVVLELARSGADLRGVVSLHGGLKPVGGAAPAGPVKAQVLVLHGGADTLVPAADVAGFAQEMLAAGAAWRFVSYPGALHAFTNPKARQIHATLPPVDWHPEAERQAMAATWAFLGDVSR